MVIKLTEAELDASLALLCEHGCSDFFPHPFETMAIKHAWDSIRPVLMAVDLLTYSPHPAQSMIAPKQKYTARKILLLDPIDHLLLGALIQRLSPVLETERVPADRDVVFSTRFDLTRPGHLFNMQRDYERYDTVVRAKLLAQPFAATADIVDFFPRIYLHRLENAVTAMGVDQQATRALMRFLKKWSDGTSYGIPTGPIFSNVLAEALLHEVDEFLLSHRVDFARFVDDYVLFGTTEAECLKGLFLLGDRLQATQGLSLNTSKTLVHRSNALLATREYEHMPDADLRRKIVRSIFGGNPYADVDYATLTDKQKQLISELDVRNMIDRALAAVPITDLTSIKFALNVLSAFRRPELVDPVLDNLQKLYPVSHAVARFFSVFDQLDATALRRISARIVDFLDGSEYVPDFQAMWLLEPFTQSAKWNNLSELRRLARQSGHRLVRRQAILALGELGDRSALLDVKTAVNDQTDWEQRAAIYACRALPADERTAFYRSLSVPNEWRIPHLPMKAVVEYAKHVVSGRQP